MAHQSRKILLPMGRAPNSVGDILSDIWGNLTSTDEATPVWQMNSPGLTTTTPAPPVATGAALPSGGVCSPSYLWRKPEFDAVHTVCGVPDYKQVTMRTVPGTSLEVFTPRDTYLYVAPGAYDEPKLSSGTPPHSYVKIGMWGNSPLFMDKGYSFSELTPELQSILKNGGKVPEAIDAAAAAKAVFGMGQGDLLVFDMGAMQKAASDIAAKGETKKMAFPANQAVIDTLAAAQAAGIKPLSQGGSTVSPGMLNPGGFGIKPGMPGTFDPALPPDGTSGGTSGETKSDGPGIGTVLLVAALAAGATYALTRK